MDSSHQPVPQAGPDHPLGSGQGGKGGAGLWILVIGGCLGVCCVLLVAGVFLAGVLAGISEDDGAPGIVSSEGTTQGSRVSASSGASGPDDFIYNSPNGLVYIAENHVSAEGVSVTLAGEWREDHRSVILRLRDGGRYELTAGGGALAGRTLSDLVASSSAEQGTWTFDGATLTLTPDGYEVSGMAERKTSSGTGKADAPRQWSVVGVTIDYTPHGEETVRQRPGLHINGPSPSWYYPAGNWDWVLRSAP